MGKVYGIGSLVTDILYNREVYEIITVATNNQVSFTLTYVPMNSGAVRMEPIGGIEFINSIDFSVSNQVVSYLGSVPFTSGEKILFKYMKQ